MLRVGDCDTHTHREFTRSSSYNTTVPHTTPEQASTHTQASTRTHTHTHLPILARIEAVHGYDGCGALIGGTEGLVIRHPQVGAVPHQRGAAGPCSSGGATGVTTHAAWELVGGGAGGGGGGGGGGKAVQACCCGASVHLAAPPCRI